VKLVSRNIAGNLHEAVRTINAHFPEIIPYIVTMDCPSGANTIVVFRGEGAPAPRKLDIGETSDQTRHRILERARLLDPDCWASYSGKPKAFKQEMDFRRTNAMAQARVLEGEMLGGRQP
jgi:hypothetical protein